MFNKNRSGKLGRHHYCKKCNSINKNQNYNYQKSKGSFLKQFYNLTEADLVNMYEKQNGKCSICSVFFEKTLLSKRKGLYIDHCHKTHKVRGLLCNKCNSGLGSFKDDASLLKKAIEYLNIPD